MQAESKGRASRIGPWVVAALLLGGAALQILPNAGRLNPDGVEYLDMAQRLAAGHFEDVFLGYWSPLFSMLMAPLLAIVPLAPPNDSALAFAVQFFTFLLGAAGYRYLLGQLPSAGDDEAGPDDREGSTAFRLLAWAAFGWATLGLIRLHYITPDMLAAALFFWATGAALRAGRRPGRGATAAALAAGVLWGLAGMAKAAMIPLAAVGIAALAVAAPGWRQAVRRGSLALVGWLVVAGPYIGGVSAEAGFLTIGSAGRLNYRWAVTRGRESAEPEVVERVRVRAIPVEPGITHLYRYDPTRPHSVSAESEIRAPSVHQQIRRLLISARAYWVMATPVLAALVALLLMDLPGLRWRRWWTLVPVWLPALAGLGMYALVFVLPRYVAPFLAAVTLTVAAGTRPSGRHAGARAPVLGGLALVLAAFALMVSVYTARLPGTPDAGGARRLLEAGPERGDAIAVVGSSLDLSPTLRAAGLQVAATVSRGETHRFQIADPDVQAAAFADMAGTGATWVVLDRPPSRPGTGWRPVRGSHLWVRPLSPDPIDPRRGEP